MGPDHLPLSLLHTPELLPYPATDPFPPWGDLSRAYQGKPLQKRLLVLVFLTLPYLLEKLKI